MDGVNLIPDDLLKIIHCGCSSEHQCKTQRCTCTKSGLAWSIFRKCKGCVTFLNSWTPKTIAGAIRILKKKKKKMNGFNKIQTCCFCCYFHYYRQLVIVIHWNLFGNYFSILSEYASISNSLNSFSSLKSKHWFSDPISIVILKEYKKYFLLVYNMSQFVKYFFDIFDANHV